MQAYYKVIDAVWMSPDFMARKDRREAVEERALGKCRSRVSEVLTLPADATDEAILRKVRAAYKRCRTASRKASLTAKTIGTLYLAHDEMPMRFERTK